MRVLPRLKLFEFCDQSWLKGLWREAYVDCLDNIHFLFAPYQNVPKLLGRWADELGTTEVLDIGSGGGEQIKTIHIFAIRNNIIMPRFTLSDLYPNTESYQKIMDQIGHQRLHYLTNSVPIANLPQEFKTMSIFSTFHHLSKVDAESLLLEIVKNRDGLCIFEFTNRRIIDLLMLLPSVLIGMTAPLSAKRFHWLKFFISTLIPIIPMMVFFDGIVSVFRSYTSDEIIEMIPKKLKSEFKIESGHLKWKWLPFARSNYVLFSRKSKLKKGGSR